jgi:hypothetical protein
VIVETDDGLTGYGEAKGHTGGDEGARGGRARTVAGGRGPDASRVPVGEDVQRRTAAAGAGARASVSARGQSGRDDPCDQRRRSRALGHLRQEPGRADLSPAGWRRARANASLCQRRVGTPRGDSPTRSSAIEPKASRPSRFVSAASTSHTFRNVRSSVCGWRGRHLALT